MVSASVSAYDFKVDGIAYEKNSDGVSVSVTYHDKEDDYNYNLNTKYDGSVVIPKSVIYEGIAYRVTSIGDHAFFKCSSLTSVTIPESVTSIGSSAFYRCSSLASITIPEGVTSIGKYAFGGCSSMTSITIPEGVTSIGFMAFSDCSSLTSISIPSSVTSIGPFAFYDCSCLTEIYCMNLIPCSLADYSFNSTQYSNIKLYVPSGAKDAYMAAKGWSNFFNVYEFELPKYQMTWVIDGEVVKTDSITIGTEIPLYTPTKEGYTFSGWSDMPATMPANDVTILGSFSVNTYKVTYIVDGEEYEVVEVKYGETIPAVEEPTKEGCEFSGWSEVPETMPAEDVTVIGSFSVIDAILGVTMDDKADVYNMNGLKVASKMAVKDLETELEKGIYIINGKKYLIK